MIFIVRFCESGAICASLSICTAAPIVTKLPSFSILSKNCMLNTYSTNDDQSSLYNKQDSNGGEQGSGARAKRHAQTAPRPSRPLLCVNSLGKAVGSPFPQTCDDGNYTLVPGTLCLAVVIIVISPGCFVQTVTNDFIFSLIFSVSNYIYF